MLSWFIFIGIITGFMIGTYYLIKYWSEPIREIDELLGEAAVEAPKSLPVIDSEKYEFAYLKNTNFDREEREAEEDNNLVVHQIYAFHPTPTPEQDDQDRKEGDIGEKEEQDKEEDFPLKTELQKVEKENKSEEEGAYINMSSFEQVDAIELIKTPVVIGENVIQRMIVTDLPLDKAAIKVRDITARILNLDTDVIEDKVIIQGIIHKQIFFVGEDNVVHHQSEDIPFSEFVDVPGAEPGMDVLIEPNIEHIVSELILDGCVLHQKVVYQFFVKVLSIQQLFVNTGEGPLVKVQKVIGENAIQTMVNNSVTLAVKAIKIVDLTAKVRDITTSVIADKVIIQGVIHKQLFYIGEDDVEHHQAEDIPFSEFVDIPGAEPGMNVQVHPDIEHIKQELSPDGLTVTQEVVLELFVKVTETIQINLLTGTDSLVMLPEVVGENTKQLMNETTITLDQLAIKIKEIVAEVIDLKGVVINDKVIIQGVIHKQIFYVGEDNIEYHQAENVPFSTFIDLMGARPGMDVDIIAEIAHIKPILSSDGALLTQKVIVDLFVKVTEDIQFNVSEAGVGPYTNGNINLNNSNFDLLSG